MTIPRVLCAAVFALFGGVMVETIKTRDQGPAVPVASLALVSR